MTYTGPLDLVPGAALAYSPARALSAAWIGSNVIKLRRDSDDATMDLAAGANGSVDVAAVTAWLAGANAFVDTLYDQSGNAKNRTQATTSRQPGWSASVTNGRPGIVNASNKLLVGAGTTAFVGCLLSIITAARSSAAGSLAGANAGSGENWIEAFERRSSGACRLLINDATFAETRVTCDIDNSAILNDFFVADGRISPSAQDLYLNGAVQTLTVVSADATGTNTAALVVGDDDATIGSSWQGEVLDVLIYNTSVTAAARAPGAYNIGIYYGISGFEPVAETAAVGGGGGWRIFNYDYQPPAKKRKKKVDDIFDDIEAALKIIREK